MTCRVCGCTESAPCVTPAGDACGWARPELCDPCEAAAEALASWLALQALNRRAGAVLATQQLIALGGKLAHDLVDEAEEETPRVVLVDEAAANAFLRSHAGGAL